MKTLYNVNITIIILIILFSSLYFLLYTNSNKEQFVDNNLGIKMYTNNEHKYRPTYIITNLLPLIEEDGYLATFKDTNDNSTIRNNLLKTNSLKGNIWTSVCSGSIDDYTLIHNLCWYRDELNSNNEYMKRLLCIGKKINEDEFTIYIKKTDNLNDKWIQYIPENSKNSKNPDNVNNTGIPIQNKMISFVMYDLNNTLIGINHTDNQIYHLDETRSIWLGPINVSDIKAKKLLFDWDRKLLCLDINNIIWKKSTLDWRNSSWIKNDTYNIEYIDKNLYDTKKNNITDIIHDTDGHLIAVTDKYSILKQISNKYTSFFKISNDIKQSPESTTQIITNTKTFEDKYYNYDEMNHNNKTLMTRNDILMNKTGIDTEKFDYIKFNDKELINASEKDKQLLQKFNFLIKFKRKFVNICKKRKNIDRDITFESINNNNTNLYSNIELLLEKLDKKGYYR